MPATIWRDNHPIQAQPNHHPDCRAITTQIVALQHWVLDVTMNEDQARNRKDNGPENIALLRRLALNLAKLEGSKGSMKGKLKQAGWNDAFLTKLLAAFAAPQMP